MKNILLSFSLLLSLSFLYAQTPEVPEYGHSLGFSGGLATGTGFTYRYLQDFGYSVSALAYYNSTNSGLTTSDSPSYFYFLGGSVMKKLFYFSSMNNNFYSLLYVFWGGTLFGGSVSESPWHGLSLSTGPGLGIEFGLLQHLALYFEVSQGGTIYLLKPNRLADFDLGPLVGGGIVYRF